MGAILCGNAALRNRWHAVARSNEVGGAPVRRTLLGEHVVLWRDGQHRVSALPDRCSHREAKLSLGAVKDGCIECPYHGWQFVADGTCTHVPSATPGVPVPPKAHLAAHRATEKFGLVWVCLGEPAAPLPDVAQDSDPSFRRINTDLEVWRTSATRMADNFLDITHFPFVHVGTFGRGQETTVPKVELGPLDGGFYGYAYEVFANNEDAGTVASGQSGGVVHRRMTSGFSLPFLCRSTIEYDTGLAHVLLLVSTPIDDVTSYFSFVVWRNDDFSVPADEVIVFDRAIGAEDKRMLETLDGVLPLDQTSLVSVQADKCSVEWRRQLAALVNG